MSDLRSDALDYHEHPTPGKISIIPTKAFTSAKDLALAYTPGVAVITDGSAVLGLGDVGALAGKPIMEGKAVLFKRFADIDVFDIEITAPSVKTFIETVANIAPTFGAINLEDIAAVRLTDTNLD